MWFWPANEMIEPTFGIPPTQFRECEEQNWFEVQAVPVFRFLRCFRLPQVEDNCSRLMMW
jgi:hypothetical protein